MIDLSVIINRFSGGIIRAQLVSLLHDLYPKEKRDVNLAIMVYDCGIASKLSSVTEIDTMKLQSFIKLLIDDYGLQEKYAIYGIGIWATYYGVTIPKMQYNDEQEQNTPVQLPVTSPDDNTAPNIVSASGSDFELTDVGDNKVVISKYLGFDEEQMIVPNVIDGKQVVGIGDSAYKGCRTMKSLIIPEGIEYIGEEAFWGCESLSEVLLPEGLKKIEKSAFCCCELYKVLLPNTVQELDEDSFDVFGRPIIYCYPNTTALECARKNGYSVKNAKDYNND